jgi:hypothetical protein
MDRRRARAVARRTPPTEDGEKRAAVSASKNLAGLFPSEQAAHLHELR